MGFYFTLRTLQCCCNQQVLEQSFGPVLFRADHRATYVHLHAQTYALCYCWPSISTSFTLSFHFLFHRQLLEILSELSSLIEELIYCKIWSKKTPLSSQTGNNFWMHGDKSKKLKMFILKSIWVFFIKN